MNTQKIKFSLIAIFCFLAISFTYSENSNDPKPSMAMLGKITGLVKDAQLKNPVEYASIALYSLKDSSLVSGAVTNTNGVFTIENVPYGEYYLYVDFIGYEKSCIQPITVSKQSKNIELKQISLKQGMEDLEEVEVVADRDYIKYEIDKKVVNVSQHVNAAGGSAADVLENVPSVNVDIEGNVTLRGSANYTVLIDGKPTVMSGNDLLKQIPASSIENIEIITNPSAKYDPEGTAGIINLVLKKEKLEGFSGVVNSAVATWDKVRGDFMMSYRKNNKVNYFASGSYGRMPRNSETRNMREMYFTDTTGFLEEKTNRTRIMRPWRFNGGADYYLSERQTLSVSGTVGGFGMFRDFDTKYHAWTEPHTIDNYSLSDNYYEVDGIYYAGKVDYQQKFAKKGHKLDVSLSAWQWDGDNSEESNEEITNNSYEPIGISIKRRSNSHSIRDNAKAKADYTLPIRKGKFEAGLQAHIATGTTGFVYENYAPENSEWINNALYTNDMLFERGLYSAYSTYANSMKIFDYQVGMRVEYTDRLVDQQTTKEKYSLELFNYYPSVHISKKLKKNQQLQLSYSRRINRPQPWNLNPFPGYSDSYNFFKGNPMLLPEDIDSYEFNYLNRIKKGMISVGAFYRQTNNTQLMAIDIDEENPNVVSMTHDNLDKTFAYGTEWMLNYELKKWCSINLSANVYQFEIDGNVSGREISQNSLSGDARLSSTFKVSKMSRVQLTGMYMTPSVEGQGTKREYYVMGLAVRHDFFKRKLTASLNVRDLLCTGNYETETINNDYLSNFQYIGEAPVVRLSLSYKINNYRRRKADDLEIGAGGM